MRLRLALFLLLGLSLAACRIENEPPPTPDPTTLGQRTFDQWCVPCHGADGEGFINALNAPSLNADGETYLLTDRAILDAIIDGGAAGGGAMVPLGDSLTDEQKAAVLEYVHTLWSDDQRAIHQHTE